MFICCDIIFGVSLMLSYLLCLYFIFITGNFSYYPIIIGILPTEKMYLSHSGKCKLLYLMLRFAT